MVNLGILHEKGLGTPQDWVQARDLFAKASTTPLQPFEAPEDRENAYVAFGRVLRAMS